MDRVYIAVRRIQLYSCSAAVQLLVQLCTHPGLYIYPAVQLCICKARRDQGGPRLPVGIPSMKVNTHREGGSLAGSWPARAQMFLHFRVLLECRSAAARAAENI